MSTDPLTDLCKRLASRRVLLRQATDARAMEALRDDIRALENQVVQHRNTTGEVVNFAAYKNLTQSA